MSKLRFQLHDDGLGEFTLANPPLNLVCLAVIDDLEGAIEAAEGSQARAVLLRAEGDSFSAGADVGQMFQGVGSAEAGRRIARFQQLAARFAELGVPSVAQVQGLCLAAGIELALACDLIWAADSAQLGLVEATIGAVPFAGGTQRVAERAGAGRAYEMAYTGRVYDAATLHRWGVLNRVLPAADLDAKTRRFASSLAQGPTRAHAVSKQLLRTHLAAGAQAAADQLVQRAPALFESRDMQHGVASLLEHGPGQASFTGD